MEWFNEDVDEEEVILHGDDMEMKEGSSAMMPHQTACYEHYFVSQNDSENGQFSLLKALQMCCIKEPCFPHLCKWLTAGIGDVSINGAAMLMKYCDYSTT